MTKKSFIAIPLCSFGAALLAAPVVAEEPMVVTGEHQPVYQQRVSFNDLDLRRWGDQQALRRRVHRASDRVCAEAFGPMGAADIGRPGSRDANMSCADLTYREARPQIIAVIDRARTGQLAAMTLIIAAPARVR